MNHYEFIEKFSAPFTALVQLRYPIKDLSPMETSAMAIVLNGKSKELILNMAR